MPLTIACPTCPTKLKVPDDAGGRRVKCPKCGGVMTVPQTTPPAPLAEARPPAPPPESPSVPVARRRDDDEGDEIPEPKKKKNDDNRPSPARRPRRDDNDPPVDTDTDASPMHKGWKSVALGYRMLGVRMLIALIGVPIVVAAGIYFDVMPHLRRLADGMPLNDRDVEELSIPFAVTGVVFGLFGLFTFLAHLFLAGMPKDRQGGRGRGLGVLMLIFLFLPGFAFLNPLLLPVFSAGVGTALGKPKLRKYGFGLYIWYAVGFILTPLLAVGAFVGGAMLDRTGTLSMAAAVAVVAILGLLVFFSVWGTYAGLRRGIQASIRDRGILGGPGPKPVKGKKRDDRDDDDDRPRKRRGEPVAKAKRVTAAPKADEPESVADLPPDDSLAPVEDLGRPAKRDRDDDSDDEIPKPKKNTRRDDDDDDDDDDRPRKRR